MSLKIALAQTDIFFEQPQVNLDAARSLILSSDADLVVLPEMFSTGFSMNVKQIAMEADAARNWFVTIAQESGRAVTGSVAVRQSVDGAIYYFNRLFFATPDGRVDHYDKRHLFRMGAEHDTYSPGNQRLVVELGGVRIMPIICYDLRFPIWCRNKGDYDLMLCVASWPDVRDTVWQTLLRARAMENLCYVGGVNRVGSDPVANYVGGTQLIDFKGETIAIAHYKAQTITQTIDMEALFEFRKKFPAHLDADKFILEG